MKQIAFYLWSFFRPKKSHKQKNLKLTGSIIMLDQINTQMDQQPNRPRIMVEQQPINPPMEIEQQPPIHPSMQIEQLPAVPPMAQENPINPRQHPYCPEAVNRFARYNKLINLRAEKSERQRQNGNQGGHGRMVDQDEQNQFKGMLRFKTVPKSNSQVMVEMPLPIRLGNRNQHRQQGQAQRMRQQLNSHQDQEKSQVKNFLKYFLIAIFILNIFIFSYSNISNQEKFQLVQVQNIQKNDTNYTPKENIDTLQSSSSIMQEGMNLQEVETQNDQGKDQLDFLNTETRYNISLAIKTQKAQKQCQCECNKFHKRLMVSGLSLNGTNSNIDLNKGLGEFNISGVNNSDNWEVLVDGEEVRNSQSAGDFSVDNWQRQKVYDGSTMIRN